MGYGFVKLRCVMGNGHEKLGIIGIKDASTREREKARDRGKEGDGEKNLLGF